MAQFDHVSQARCQLGSTHQTFSRSLTALDRTLNPHKVATTISILSDEPTKVDFITRKAWVPENDRSRIQGRRHRTIRARRLLNIPAVNVLQRVGLPAFTNTLRSFHVAHDILSFRHLPLVLGLRSSLELTGAFGGIANSGRRIELLLYRSSPTKGKAPHERH